MRRHLTSHFSQLRKSWYMFFFQLPWLPERALGVQGGERTIRDIQSASPPGAFTEEDVQGYLAAWGQPGAWTGMINWYRALFQKPPASRRGQRIPMPVRIIWGKRDAFLDWDLAEKSLELCDQGDLFLIEDASHFVQHDAPDQVNELLLAFFEQK
jgi:pimeloyl-ACP methyl ester carboxylesterase